jgi:hypothetical protein
MGDSLHSIHASVNRPVYRKIKRDDMRETSRLDKAHRRPMDPLSRRVTQWNGTIGSSVRPFIGIAQSPRSDGLY